MLTRKPKPPAGLLDSLKRSHPHQKPPTQKNARVAFLLNLRGGEIGCLPE
jgi:hypothetical protein